jgi:hypothetical protein
MNGEPQAPHRSRVGAGRRLYFLFGCGAIATSLALLVPLGTASVWASARGPMLGHGEHGAPPPSPVPPKTVPRATAPAPPAPAPFRTPTPRSH